MRQSTVKSVNVFGKAIDDAARRRHVKEGHRRVQDIVEHEEVHQSRGLQAADVEEDGRYQASHH